MSPAATLVMHIFHKIEMYIFHMIEKSEKKALEFFCTFFTKLEILKKNRRGGGVPNSLLCEITKSANPCDKLVK